MQIKKASDYYKMIQCNKCKQWKNELAYYRNNKLICKDCQSDDDVRQSEKDKNQKIIERNIKSAKDSLKKRKLLSDKRNKKYTVARKLKVLSAYGGLCACCGEDRIEFLAIDHIFGGGGKERATGLKGAAFYCYLIKNNFPDGYRVLRHNCNFSIGVYGYCPHDEHKYS